jgi:hypothetical protein
MQSVRDRWKREEDEFFARLAQDENAAAMACIERHPTLTGMPTFSYVPVTANTNYSSFTGGVKRVYIPCGDERDAQGLLLCRYRKGEHKKIRVSYAPWSWLEKIKVCPIRVEWWNKHGRFWEARQWRRAYTFYLRSIPQLVPALNALIQHCRAVGTALTWPRYIVLTDYRVK